MGAAIGREFGSPDFERLMEEDHRNQSGVFDPALRPRGDGRPRSAGGERVDVSFRPNVRASPTVAAVAGRQGYWNLRVVQFDAGEDSYSAVHEVYYDADGHLRGYSEEPAVVMWTVDDEPDAPQRAIERMQRALAERPIDVKEFG